MSKVLFYFGCVREKGHFLFKSENGHIYSARHGTGDTRVSGLNEHVLNPLHLDGLFTPVATGTGRYQVSTIPPALIVSWHDNSVDTRPGSHSTFVGVGYKDAEEMLDDAAIQFKEVMVRQSRPRPAEVKCP